MEREFAREYHLITRDERLDAVAKDLVSHFMGRGFQGKAMMICIDKATAVRMYDKVRVHWSAMIEDLRKENVGAEGKAKVDLEQRISWMEETDMAVVVSQGQNEIAEMNEKGLDIRPHRKRIVDEDLETKFKTPDDPFRLAFVCAMWMTGFDVPSCSTLYLDKPMRNHTLMQTIARANRVYPGKVNGLIVDYAGVFRNIEKALAIYGVGGGDGKNPIEDKVALVAALRKAQDDTRVLCQKHNIDLAAIRSAEGFERIGLLDDAVESLVTSEKIKRQYLDLANTAKRLYKAVLPDTAAQEFAAEIIPVQVIAEKIRALIPPADISQVMQQVETLLDQSIATEGYVIRGNEGSEVNEGILDLSTVDFEKLAEKFKTSRKRTLTEQLKGSVGQKLMAMVRFNRTRMDYLEKYQEMIDAYNSGSLNVEEFFLQLVDFAKSLDEEEQRGLSEQLSEEELALFDLLTKPNLELNDKERDKVKSVAKDLLNTLKEGKLVLDWRKRQQARAEVLVTIEKVLDEGLPPTFTPELFEQKTVAVFQHVHEAYFGAGQSIYAEVA